MSTLAHNRKNTTQTGTFTSTPGRVLERTCACGQHTDGGECAECRQKGEGMLQRAGMNPVAVNSAPPIVHKVLNSPGQPLDTDTRTFMESRFSHDFSLVRVRTMPPGKTYTKLTVNEPGDQYEQEADRMAHTVAHLPASEAADGKISPQQFPFKKKINAGSRGRVFVDTAGLLASNLPSCDDFLKDVKQLRPDNESCVGVTATPNPKGAAVEAPDDNALAGLEEADSGRANEEAAQVSQGDSTEQANEGVSSENVA